MKKFVTILLCVGFVGLAGCNKADADAENAKKDEPTKQTIMGDGKEKLKPGQHLGGL